MESGNDETQKNLKEGNEIFYRLDGQTWLPDISLIENFPRMVESFTLMRKCSDFSKENVFTSHFVKNENGSEDEYFLVTKTSWETQTNMSNNFPNEIAFMYDKKCEYHEAFEITKKRIFSGNDVMHENIEGRSDVSNAKQTMSTVTFLQENLLLGVDDSLHHGVKDFLCHLCNKKFSQQRHLKEHMVLHTSTKKYHCHLCDKRFALQRYLKEHMLVHTGIKNYHCHLCDKRFALQRYLKEHMLIHTGTKNYDCVLCDKKFARQGQLNQHFLVHTGTKNYDCALCDKMFARKGNLKQHMLVHTGIKSYLCGLCDKKFARKGELKNHVFGHAKLMS